MSNRPTFIYGLKDPRDQRVYYIGKANNPKSRLSEHLKDIGTNPKKEDWLLDLAGAGFQPEVVILEETTLANWQDCERKWIAYGWSQRYPLTNISAGGNGMGQLLNASWVNVLRDFLSPLLLKKFRKMDEQKQKEIAKQAAKAARDYSGHKIENTGAQFHKVSEFVSRLVERD